MPRVVALELSFPILQVCVQRVSYGLRACQIKLAWDKGNVRVHMLATIYSASRYSGSTEHRRGKPLAFAFLCTCSALVVAMSQV